MSFRFRRHLTAWLGLFAMWLVVCVPLVSQLAASAHVHDALCSAAAPAHGAHRAMPMSMHTMHGRAMSMPGMSMSAMPMPMSRDGGAHSQSDMLAACGYCDLLADHIAIPSLPPLLPPFVLVLAFVVATVLSTRYTPLGAFPSGQPRAPPVLRPSSL